MCKLPREIGAERSAGRINGKRHRLRHACAAALALAAAGASPAAWAQSAAPGSVIYLDAVTVEGTALSEEGLARARLQALAGGTALIPAQDLEGKTNLNISDALASVPGVIVQNFFGGNDQPRVQIRGSGLQQNPVERGVLVLQNGLPINRADGSYIVGLANPWQAETIEVYRGYTANRLGATVLGGALNFWSPTGSTAAGVVAGVEGGSFGQINATAQAGLAKGNFDALAQVSASRRDGYRDYNGSERFGFDANVGAQINPEIKTRFFAGYTDLGFDVAGPLPKAVLKSNPKSVHPGPTVVPPAPPTVTNPGPNVHRDRPRRDASQYRIGNRTTAEYGASVFDAAFGYSHTDDEFRFPISSGIRVTEGGDANAVFRYAYSPDPARPLPLFETTVNFVSGSADREYYLNNSGTRGALFGSNDLSATTFSLSAGFHVPVAPNVTLSPAIAWSHATRDNTDTYGLPTRPTIAFNPLNQTMALPNGAVPTVDTSYARDYSGFSPSLGLTFRPVETQTLFAAVSRSFEPPTHDDLMATVNGTPFSSAGRPVPGNPALVSDAFRTPDLKAQTATTLEGGWHGQSGIWSWDAVTYYSWVKNELLSLRDVTGASLGAVNADKTRHFGVELGLGAALAERLSGRLAYTFQDFRFVDDPVRGNNRLAGAPRHTINVLAQYKVLHNLTLGTEIQWSPEKTPVDNMNTLFADPYVVVDLRADYGLGDGLSIYGEVRNIFDETYASSTLIVDQARADQAAFLPGDGRAFYIGLRKRFGPPDGEKL